VAWFDPTIPIVRRVKSNLGEVANVSIRGRCAMRSRDKPNAEMRQFAEKD